MTNASEGWLRRATPELVAVISLGLTILLTVLGQAVWLDGKIERVDARLSAQIERVDAKLTAQIENVDARLTAQIEKVDTRLSTQIEGLQAGQAAIRERLVAIEALSGVAVSPTAGNQDPQDPVL